MSLPPGHSTGTHHLHAFLLSLLSCFTAANCFFGCLLAGGTKFLNFAL